MRILKKPYVSQDFSANSRMASGLPYDWHMSKYIGTGLQSALLVFGVCSLTTIF